MLERNNAPKKWLRYWSPTPQSTACASISSVLLSSLATTTSSSLLSRSTHMSRFECFFVRWAIQLGGMAGGRKSPHFWSNLGFVSTWLYLRGVELLEFLCDNFGRATFVGYLIFDTLFSNGITEIPTLKFNLSMITYCEVGLWSGGKRRTDN